MNTNSYIGSCIPSDVFSGHLSSLSDMFGSSFGDVGFSKAWNRQTQRSRMSSSNNNLLFLSWMNCELRYRLPSTFIVVKMVLETSPVISTNACVEDTDVNREEAQLSSATKLSRNSCRPSSRFLCSKEGNSSPPLSVATLRSCQPTH